MAVTSSISALTSGTTTAAAGIDGSTLAKNFDTFLQLLTTQLKNQSPLDPLDTNQFTQQLVQFAQVEQQMRQNDQLATLISLEKAAATTTALAFVGTRVAVDGETAPLANGRAIWTFSIPKPVSATVTIRDSAGQTVYSGTFTMNPGDQSFAWDGRDNNGVVHPDGNYTLSITAKDAAGQTVGVPTEIEGVVDSVDLTQTPPMLTIGGREFPVDSIKRVVRPGA